jgi:hypothetical protein
MRKIFFDEIECNSWLIDKGVLHNPLICECCNGDISVMEKCQMYPHIVPHKVIYYERKIFALSRLECCEILYFGYLWITNCTSDIIRDQTGHSTGTVTAYCNYFRQLISSMLETEDEIIGDEGVVIQVEETKMG